jgi:hypothetical protein
MLKDYIYLTDKNVSAIKTAETICNVMYWNTKIIYLLWTKTFCTLWKRYVRNPLCINILLLRLGTVAFWSKIMQPRPISSELANIILMFLCCWTVTCFRSLNYPNVVLDILEESWIVSRNSRFKSVFLQLESSAFISGPFEQETVVLEGVRASTSCSRGMKISKLLF